MGVLTVSGSSSMLPVLPAGCASSTAVSVASFPPPLGAFLLRFGRQFLEYYSPFVHSLQWGELGPQSIVPQAFT